METLSTVKHYALSVVTYGGMWLIETGATWADIAKALVAILGGITLAILQYRTGKLKQAETALKEAERRKLELEITQMESEAEDRLNHN